jgi:hypothetical protein
MLVEAIIMTNTQRIKLALTYSKMSEAELARRLSSTSSAFNQRMQRNAFDEKDLWEICAILGAEYVSRIRFPDGTEF